MIEQFQKKKITLYGDGNYVRDFIYLEDVIMGIIYALKNCNKLHKDYYYLTTELGKSFNDLEKIINSELYKIYKFTAKVNYKKWPNTSIILDKRSFVGNSFLFKKVTTLGLYSFCSNKFNFFIFYERLLFRELF